MTNDNDPGLRLAPGDAVGDYVLEKRLGHGTESQVYLARDSLLGRRVALKVPRSQIKGTTRGVEEARLAARLEHAHLVRTYHAFRSKGVWFIAYAFAEGGTVEDRVQTKGTYTVAEALQLARQVAGALSYMHQEGVLHRDVKPSNILLTRSHEPVLSDLGLALDMRSPSAETMPTMGTPAYLAPELWAGNRASTASDVYAFGMCLYFLLAGRLTFPFADLEQLKQAHLTLAPKLPARWPAGVSELVLATLEKDPRNRPDSAALLRIASSVAAAPHRAAKARRATEAAIREPTTADSLSRGLRAAFERGPEHHYLSELSGWLREGASAIAVASEPLTDAELLLDAGLVLCGGQCEVVARLIAEPGGRFRTEETPGQHGETFASLATALSARARVPSLGRRPVVLACIPRLSGLSAPELRDMARLAQERRLCLVCVLPVSLLEYDPFSSWSAAFKTLKLPGAAMPWEDFSARLSCWQQAAVVTDLRFTVDAARALRHAHAAGDDPTSSWARLAQSSLMVAAAAQQPWVTSWSVLAATRQARALRETSDVPVELRRPPSRWPTPEVLAWLERLRLGEPAQLEPVSPSLEGEEYARLSCV